MKQKLLLKTMLLLCALVAGSGTMWATDTPDYTFTLADEDFTSSSHSKTSGALTWTVSYGTGVTESYGWESSYGFKFGSGNKSYPTAFTLTSSSVSNKIKKVVVTASVNSNKSCKLDVKVGSTTYGSQATINTKNNDTWEFSIADASTVSGAVELSFSSNTGPLYLKQIDIYYYVETNVNSLTIGTAPTKLNYKVGEKLDLTGLILNADGNNVTSGYTAKIGETAVTSGTTVLNTIGVQTITFTYGGKTCTQDIHVGTLQSIAITTSPTKTTYNEGDNETFDPTGMVVKATFSDGETTPTEWQETLESNDYTYSPTTALHPSNTSITVSYTWGDVTKTAVQPISVNAGPKYTVTFNVASGTGTVANNVTSLTEAAYQGGVELPNVSCSKTGWVFAGWATSTVENTTTKPTLYTAGSTYKPTAECTVYAVYKLADVSNYKRATSVNEITSSSSVVIVSNNSNNILDTTFGTVSAPTESSSLITAPENAIFILTGDNTDGYTLTNSSTTIGTTSTDNSTAISNTTTNDLWKVKASSTSNCFYFENTAKSKLCLEYYDSSWMVYAPNTPSSNVSVAMKVYVPITAYNSTPSEIITPSISFEKSGTTIYLEANDKTYTNAANVTGVNKTVTYKSSDTNVATVDANGLVTAKKIGTATITASVDAELGVSTAASDAYVITVKSATTLAGIKAQATSSTAVDFSADLASDLVITYVNGTHAYLQSGDVAVYATCATEDWIAGKKFTGAITGQVKQSSSEYIISQLNEIPVTGGTVPDAIAVAISDITTANYATYEGRKVVVNGATIHTAMASNSASGGKITTDGTNTLNIYAPLKGITLVKNEKGNITGFVSRNGNSLRLCLYEQNMFVKTHNVPQDQEMSFATASYNLDEETDAVTGFAGQTVTATTVKGALTYSIKDGSDDIITSLNETTGAVVLNGACGTATIVATAAYAEELDNETGYYTPYKELTKEYSITVRPRYSVTFSINGNTDEVLRQESYGAAITAPEVAAVGDYVFRGWSDTEVATTNTAPTMTTAATITPDASKTVYAVFAIQAQTGTTDVLDQEYSKSAGTLTVGGTYTTNNAYYLLHEGGYVESEEFDLSIISKVVVYGGTYGGSDYNSLTIGDGTNTWKEVTVSGSSNTGTNTFTGGTALSGTGKLRITSTCGGTTNGVRVSGFEIYKLGPVYGYTNYTTSLSANVTIGDSHYLSFCFLNKLDFSETAVKAYKASVDTETGKVTLTKVDVVPAEEGVILHCATPGNYEIPVTTADASDVTGNEMVGVLTRTQVLWNVGDKYNYILQQGEFNKATTGYLKANRAYLSTSYDVSAAGARPLKIVFSDESTGIDTIEHSPLTIDRYYNLKGQRVDNPKKGGLYIMNGKKVVIK